MQAANNYEQMIKKAAEWRNATMKVAHIIGQLDKRKQLKLSNMTTKGDLDAYLMKQFGVDDITARSISNALTDRNTPINLNVDLSPFRNEKWMNL